MNACPNCTAPLKSGLLNFNNLVSADAIAFADAYNTPPVGGFCQKCYHKAEK